MRKLFKVIKISTKEAFKRVRSDSPFFCVAVDKNFSITNKFMRHISGSAKKRGMKEIIERLSIVNLIGRISEKGLLVEMRNDPIIEGLPYILSYKIGLQIKKIGFYLILAEKKSGEVILISAFLNA